MRTLAFLTILGAAATAKADERIDHLTAQCKLWGAVRYGHPWLVYKPSLDWDAAYVAAVPKVSAARTLGETRAALGSMLAALGDPATQMVSDAANADGGKPVVRHDGKVLIVDLGAAAAAARAHNPSPLADAPKEIAEADAVVYDVRDRSADGTLDDLFYTVYDRPRRRLEIPGNLVTYRSGFPPQESGAFGIYSDGLLVRAGQSIEADPTAKPQRVVIVATGGSAVPDLAVALQAAGEAVLVSSGPLAVPAGSTRIPVGEGLEALVRSSEGLRAPVPDVIAADPMAAALRVARGELKPSKKSASTAQPTPTPSFRRDATYASMSEPSVEYRLLALCRHWTIIDRFYPYKSLIGDWNAVLPEMIPRFERAQGARGYTLAVAELAAKVADGHTSVRAPELDAYLGKGRPRFTALMIEGQPAVIQVDAIEKSGISVGDVILEVDGEPLAARMKRLEPITPAATTRARNDRLLARSILGPPDMPAQFKVRDKTGQIRTLVVPRVKFGPPPPSTEPSFKLLTPDVGYADLTRLTVPQVNPMFDAFKDTKAIIFDMRGYPNGTAWSIAPRLNVKGAKRFADLRNALQIGLGSLDESDTEVHSQQGLSPSSDALYRGATTMLIDDRAISQAEHTGLFFEAAAGTRFVGTPTAGSNGDVTSMTLPGGIIVFFTGHDVRHVDGRQLQRVGLQPDVVAEPTLAGLRAGKDEVLDKALDDLAARLHIRVR